MEKIEATYLVQKDDEYKIEYSAMLKKGALEFLVITTEDEVSFILNSMESIDAMLNQLTTMKEEINKETAHEESNTE